MTRFKEQPWWSLFPRFALVGVANTALHWLVFALLFGFLGWDQAKANLAAFGVAVTFSFFVNARFTFNKTASAVRYGSFVLAMGALSYATGWLADMLATPPLLTLMVFSALSLILGFAYARFCVFR